MKGPSCRPPAKSIIACFPALFKRNYSPPRRPAAMQKPPVPSGTGGEKTGQCRRFLIPLPAPAHPHPRGYGRRRSPEPPCCP